MVGGGSHNTAGALNSVIAGGSNNKAITAYATIAGGTYNTAGSIQATAGGGGENTASSEDATIAGGYGNVALFTHATVGGGTRNRASSLDATVAGGSNNTSSGAYAAVGGSSNQAAGAFSFAAGSRTKIRPGQDGTFLFADSNDVDFRTLNANEFAARATGGVRFVTAIDASGNPAGGVRLPKEGGSWEAFSDCSAKVNFAPVVAREILARLGTMPIETRSYRIEDPAIRHIGPTAPDWSVLGPGKDGQCIDMMDVSGVALAAIRELDQLTKEQDAQIKALKAENAERQAHIATLDSRLAMLERQVGMGDTRMRSFMARFPFEALDVGALGLVLWPLFKKVAGSR